MKDIDLDSLSEAELRDLNREIVRRLDLMSLMRRKMELMAFRVGDRVVFQAEVGRVTGVVIRINHKTASVQGDDGRGWRVSPGLLTKFVDTADTEIVREAETNVLRLPASNPKSM